MTIEQLNQMLDNNLKSILKCRASDWSVLKKLKDIRLHLNNMLQSEEDLKRKEEIENLKKKAPN